MEISPPPSAHRLSLADGIHLKGFDGDIHGIEDTFGVQTAVIAQPGIVFPWSCSGDFRPLATPGADGAITG